MGNYRPKHKASSLHPYYDINLVQFDNRGETFDYPIKSDGIPHDRGQVLKDNPFPGIVGDLSDKIFDAVQLGDGLRLGNASALDLPFTWPQVNNPRTVSYTHLTLPTILLV